MYTIFTIIIVLLIGCIILGLITGSKKSISRKESYGQMSDNKQECKGIFPPPPDVMPQSAYAALVTPFIPSSASNPEIPNNMHEDLTGGSNFYSDKFVCKTPWRMRAFNNDSCAQFSIGESAQGPEGNKYCVCEAVPKDGRNDKELTPDNIVISIGGVCSEDSQCCTGRCGSVPGQFSKSCQCPQEESWNGDLGRCIANFNPNKGAYSTIWDNSSNEYYPQVPAKTALTTGKLCSSQRECGLGESCTPDNFCASQVVPDKETYGNKFFAGANCTADSQCANNLNCINGQCACKAPLIFEWLSARCQCADGSMSLSNGVCMPPSQVPRTICPSLPGSFTSGISGCGLGERFNPSTMQCMCSADLHTGKIERGGKCIDSSQCKTGGCYNYAGTRVCIEPESALYELAVAEYL